MWPAAAPSNLNAHSSVAGLPYTPLRHDRPLNGGALNDYPDTFAGVQQTNGAAPAVLSITRSPGA